MSSTGHAVLLLAVVAAMTMFVRFLPFLVFQKKTPEPIVYLGDVLPYAVMGMLVVYCLRQTNVLSGNHGIPEIVSCAVVFILHKWKHNTLLSILAGTVCYMLLVQRIN